MHRPETNPHFLRPLQPEGRPQHSQQHPQAPPDQPQSQDPYSEPTTASPPPPPPQDRPARAKAPRLKNSRRDPYPGPSTQSSSQPDHPERPQRQGLHGAGSQSQDQPVRAPRSKTHRQEPYPQPPSPHGPKSKSPDRRVQQPRPRVQIQDPVSPSDSHRRDHHHHPQHSDRRTPQNILLMPLPRQTNPLMWFGAVFCAIFWVLVIVGGLAVLIVYLIFRPKSPRFDVATANLNAAYLDMGYLLNADVNLLVNFTNPNKKVSVDFSSIILDIYFGNTRIATQFIEPFSAPKQESKLVNVHMVSSQVRLPVLERQRLQKQMERNGIRLDMRGIFKGRSNFGSLLRYSYWLHSYCTLIVGGPPDGVLMRSKCRTKH